MADELDDLFGAIDGDVEESTDLAVSEKKDDSTGMAMEGGGALPSKDAKKIYSSVMNLSTASHLRSDRASAAEKVDEKKEDEDKSSTKDIATGTSHDKSVRSYSAYPKNLPEGHELPKPSTEPAKEYPFPLDPFQEQAIAFIEKEESVLVAAHTSAGKTAVAEYAIAKSLKNGQRVVYTSPIKVRNGVY